MTRLVRALHTHAIAIEPLTVISFRLSARSRCNFATLHRRVTVLLSFAENRNYDICLPIDRGRRIREVPRHDKCRNNNIRTNETLSALLLMVEESIETFRASREKISP